MNRCRAVVQFLLCLCLVCFLAAVVAATVPMKLVKTIATPATPQAMAVDATRNVVYLSCQGADCISVIDGKRNTILVNIPVGDAPLGIAYNPDTQKIYVVNSGDDTVSVINAITRTVIATIPVRLNASDPAEAFATAPMYVWIDTTANKIYVTNYGNPFTSGGGVSIIDGNSNVLIDTLPTSWQAQGISGDESQNKVYVTHGSGATPNDIAVIDTTTDTVTAWITTSAEGHYNIGQCFINPLNDRLYFANYNDDTIGVISTPSDTYLGTFVGTVDRAGGIAVDAKYNQMYITNLWQNAVSVIDCVDDSLIQWIQFGAIPSVQNDGTRHVAVMSATSAVFVSNGDTNTIKVLKPNPPKRPRK